MSRITYFIGRDVDSRQKLLNRKMADEENVNFLHLVPTRGRVIELEPKTDFWIQRRINTLTGVIYQIFDEDIRLKQFRGFRPVDDSLRSLLVKKVLHNRGQFPDGLVYFADLFENNGTRDFPGIYRIISRFFSMLVKDNYQDRFANHLAGKIIRLEEKDPGSGESAFPLESDLTWLFGDYEEIKRDIRGYDEDDVISSVRSFLKEGLVPRILKDVDAIIFDGFIYLSKAEEDILYYLFSFVKDVYWLIDYDSQSSDPVNEFKDSSGRNNDNNSFEPGVVREFKKGEKEAYRIFAPLVSLMEKLEDSGAETTFEKCDENPLLNPVAGGLYINSQTNNSSVNHLMVSSFPNRLEEVRAIAGEIKRIVYEDKLDESSDLGKIRVIFPNLNDYSSLVFEVFNEYRIPFSLTKGLPLNFHPVSSIFLNIFEVVLSGFDRDMVFRLFSSKLIKRGYCSDPLYNNEDFSDISKKYLLKGDRITKVSGFLEKSLKDPGSVFPDMFFIDRVSKEIGIDRFSIDLISQNSKEISLIRDYYLEKLEKTPGKAGKERFRNEYYRYLLHMKVLEQRLRPFRVMAEQKSSHDILDRFIQILELLGFPFNIMDIGETESITEDIKDGSTLKRDIKAYSLMNDLLTASANELQIEREIFEVGDGYDLLSRYYAIFSQRVNNAYLMDERNPNVVRISQWLETRGRSFDYIFAGGLTAESFPLHDEVNFILPESGMRVFRVPDPIDLSRHLFSHILRNYREKLYLSYPGYCEERESQRSQVLVDMESMLSSSLPSDVSADIEEYFKWDKNPFFASKEEMLNARVMKDIPCSDEKDDHLLLRQVILKDEIPCEDLIRGINTLNSRQGSDGLSEYDGIIGDASKSQGLVKGDDQIFSPSRLEVLANCPMRYMFQNELGLRPMEAAGSEISPKDMGEHIHAILGLFFKRLMERGVNVSQLGLKEVFGLADKVSEEYFVKHSFTNKMEFSDSQILELTEGLDSYPSESDRDEKGRYGILAGMLCFEKEQFRERAARGIEYGFGHNDQPVVQLGSVRIRGYIDRFDCDSEDDETIYIYDYKSGNIPSSSMIKRGLSFQIPAYIRALRTILPGSKKISASFYLLKRDILLDGNPLKQVINYNYEGARGLDISGVALIDDYVNHLAGLINDGCFHHSADGLSCNYCEFKYACHMDLRRIQYLMATDAGSGIYSGEKNLEKWRGVDHFRKEWKSVSKSMNKALTLKTESARVRHYEGVIRFREKLKSLKGSSIFKNSYLDDILDKINSFEEKYTA